MRLDFWSRGIDEMGDRADELRSRARRGVCDERSWTDAIMPAVAGAVAGAAAAMLLDPQRGKARRARLMDQGAAVVRRTAREAGRSARRVQSDVDGMIKAAQEGQNGNADLNDATLAEKIQSEVFGDPSLPKGSLNVNVERGIAVLRGEVTDEGMRRKLERETRKIPGVRRVTNLLHLPGEPAATAG